MPQRAASGALLAPAHRKGQPEAKFASPGGVSDRNPDLVAPFPMIKNTLLAALFALAPTAFAAQSDYAALERRAESLVAEGSYAKAHEVYEQASRLELGEAERRWVRFRLADTRWRSAAATESADTTPLDEARAELEALASAPERPEQRDRIWAEVMESLGDWSWQRRDTRDWGGGQQHYLAALDWWAGSDDVERARERYLAIVFRAAEPTWWEANWGYATYGNQLPIEVLQNAARVARTREERAHAHWLLGSAWQNQGPNGRAPERAAEALRVVLELGRGTEWYDDALFQLAQHLENVGVAERRPDGSWTYEPDYVGAVALYRRLLDELKQGETRHWRSAQERLENLTSASVDLSVDRFFLPDSEIRFDLGWRNVRQVELALYPLDLTRDVRFGAQDWRSLADAVVHERMAPRKAWTFETEDDGRHRPGRRSLVLDEKLPLGAWLLVARGGDEWARALVLVSDAALTVKGSGTRLLTWATDLETGRPIEGARVALWYRYHDREDYRLVDATGTTAADGTCLFELPTSWRNGDYFVAAKAGERQAFVQGSLWGGHRSSEREWRIHAFTDRSAYRPLDTVQWKMVARTRDGGAYETPAGERVTWAVFDPLGSRTAQGTLTLNAFGAAWSSIETTRAMPLGEYTVHFYGPPKGRPNDTLHLGQAALFRLEEYKLPEFEVTVAAGTDDDGEPARYQLGDTVTAVVQADYYYGAPVAEATVEVFVWQRPFWMRFPKEREFPWFYADENVRDWWGGPGQQIAHQTVRTDRDGRAVITFETPADQRQDLEYTIEARVVDASRREIVGTGSVRVTRQEYYVQLDVAHAIHRPGANVDVEIETSDANRRPLPAAGVVRVLRDRWIEVWIDPQGNEVFGDALERAREAQGSFPPRTVPAWSCIRRGYESEVVMTSRVETGADGRARLRFTPQRDGTYRVQWSGDDARGSFVQAETRFFVADERSRQLGYLPGGVEIVTDDDTFEVGSEAAVMLLTSASNRWVLFTVEGEALHHYEVVHLDGTVKLMRVPIGEEHVPNVWLGATMVADRQGFSAQKELVVPPVRQFLDVEVTHASATYMPGERGRLDVAVRDHAGRPVAVDLSIAVVDEALAYIQGDYGGDPRKTFYGERRALRVYGRGTFDMGSFQRLVKNEEGEVVEEGFDEDLRKKVGSYRGAGDTVPPGGGGRQADYEMRDELSALGYAAKESDSFALGRGYPNAPLAAPQGSLLRAGGPAADTVRVRSDFRETALWTPDVTTDASGRASVEVPYPDSTTRWRATVRAADVAARFGIGSASARTRQPLICRLQAPRFFQVGDEVTVTGNVMNESEEELAIQVAFEARGLELLGRVTPDGLADALPPVLSVAARDRARIDWRVRVTEPGAAVLKLTALGGEYGDALERTLPVLPHGIDALVARGGKFDADELAFALPLPAARGADTTSLEIQVTPSMAVTMLDALPYLVDYPYGCAEQTLSRFVPAVIVAKTLGDFGLSAEDALNRVFGGVEQQFAGRTHPQGRRNVEQLDRIVRDGLDRLYGLQHGDGGWGWWAHDESEAFMTAYVLWGLSLAREAGVDVKDGVLANGARWLALHLVEQELVPDLQAWMLHSLAVYGGGLGADGDAFRDRAFANLWKRKDALNAYTRALFALAAHHLGRAEDARVLVANLENGVKLDATPDTSVVQRGAQSSQPWVLKTARWGEDRMWRRWSEGGVEATAFALRAILAIDPTNELVPSVTNWLVKNRRGAQWSNTRDTAIVVLALNDYLRASGELGQEIGYEVSVNGTRIASEHLTRDQLLRAPGRYAVPSDLLRNGDNDVVIRRTAGTGPLYFAAHARFFSEEEPIPARGNELFVRREYYKLVGRPTLLKGTVYDRVPLQDGESVQSGERIEVVLTIESKNELEYLVFEDLKPAGFEAVSVRSGEPLSVRELRSGEVGVRFGTDEDTADSARRGTARDARIAPQQGPGYTGRAQNAHQELRDRKVALFLSKLPQGIWEARYDLRAEVPGSFHALPLLGHAMYVPEIRCNGEELRLEVLDAPQEAR